MAGVVRGLALCKQWGRMFKFFCEPKTEPDGMPSGSVLLIYRDQFACSTLDNYNLSVFGDHLGEMLFVVKSLLDAFSSEDAF